MSENQKKKYYITTAIAYTSSKPHVGNTYEAVLADSIARFKREQGYDVFFQTGTDEHGQKIEEKASAAGKTPKQYVDEVSDEIKKIWDLMDVSTINLFVRPTRLTKNRFRKSSINSIKTAIYTKALTKAGIVRRANRSGRKVSLWTANVQIAAEKSKRRTKRRIFSK